MNYIKISFYTLQLGNQPIVNLNMKFAEYLRKGAFPNSRIQFVAHDVRSDWREVDRGNAEVIQLKSMKILGMIREFRKYLATERPDVVFASTPIRGFVAMVARMSLRGNTKIVFRIHQIISIDLARHKSIFDRYGLRLFFKYFWKKYYKIVCVSNDVSRDFCGWIDAKCGNIMTIYNPVRTRQEVEHLEENLSHPWMEQKDFPVIVMVNRLSFEKDVATALRAVAELNGRNKVRLIILGTGELLGELEALAGQLGIGECVDFYGFCRNPFYFFDRADLFLLSSVYEGFGNVIVEALSTGCPVVATDCPGGPREILDNGKYGELVPVGDSSALAAAMERSLKSEHDRDALRARAQEFSIDVQGKMLEKVVADALAGR